MKQEDTLQVVQRVADAVVAALNEFQGARCVALFIGTAIALEGFIKTMQETASIGPLPPTTVALQKALADAIEAATGDVLFLDALLNGRN